MIDADGKISIEEVERVCLESKMFEGPENKCKDVSMQDIRSVFEKVDEIEQDGSIDQLEFLLLTGQRDELFSDEKFE